MPQSPISIKKGKGLRLQLIDVGAGHRGTPVKLAKKEPDSVSVITCTHRPGSIDQILNNYLRQSYQPKELIIILNNNRIILDKWLEKTREYPDINVYQLDEKVSLGQCFNYGAELAKFKYIAKFDDDDYYAPQFLAESMAAFNYCRADIIGKATRFVYFVASSVLALYQAGAEHAYVDYVVGATLIFKKAVLTKVPFPDITAGDDSVFQSECLKKGFRIYSTDRYNYVTIRSGEANRHTFKLSDEDYLSHCRIVAHTPEYLTYITRP